MKVLSARTEDHINERIDCLFCDVSGPRATSPPDNTYQFSPTAAVRKLTNLFLVSGLSSLRLIESSGRRDAIAAPSFLLALPIF